MAEPADEAVKESSFWLWTFLGRLHPMFVHFPISLLFIALFMDLGAETSFNSLVYARQSVIDGKALDEQKKAVEAHGGLFEQGRTQYADMDEEELAFLSALPNGEGFRF